MSTPQPETRAERRAVALERRRAERRSIPFLELTARQRRTERLRKAAFALVGAAVLAVGGYLAFGDLVGRPDSTSAASAIPVRLSMAGFTPSEIQLKAGEVASLELWTTDAAPHLQNGVHTMISDELRIYEELPAAGVTGASRKVVTLTAPATPGTYDIYCDTCCGGKQSPAMHGKLVVEA